MSGDAGVRDDRRLWVAYGLIALGALWLLVVLGFVPRRVVLGLWNTWPLLLVGVGLDLLAVRRVVANLPWTGLALAAAVVVGLIAPAGGGAIDVRYAEPIGAAERAEVRLDLGSAPTELGALPRGADALIEAEIVDVGRVAFEVDGDRSKRVRLEKRGGGPTLGAIPSRWDLALTRALPLELRIDGGSGASRLDLSNLQLVEVGYDGGSGSTTLDLPGGRYRATLETGSGSSRIGVGAGAELELTLDTGSGSTTLRLPDDGRVTLRLDSGSGSVTIDAPDDAAVEVVVEDDGSGRLSVGAWLERVEGSGDTGRWASAPARGGAPPVVRIVVADAGSGSVRIE